MYNNYHSLGLEIFSLSEDRESEVLSYIEKHDIPWECIAEQVYGGTRVFSPFLWTSPMVNVFDNSGKLIFSSEYLDDDYNDLAVFLEDKLGKVQDTKSVF